MTWVLILTLAAWSTDGGVAIKAVHGFTSEQQCIAAARTWLSSLGGLRAEGRALCAEQGGAR